MFFCRSHERLACVVRILAAGFGWVTVEIRGLEMQEPTSCHHVEAGRVDDAFAHVLTGAAIMQSSLFSAGGAVVDEEQHHLRPHRSEGALRNGNAPFVHQENLGPFALRPVCEVTALCYEQTELSLRGIIDNPETLRQLHRLFLKVLVWVLAQECRRINEEVPKDWLSCPLESRDAQMVVNLLKTTHWPRQVADQLGGGLAISREEDLSRPITPVAAAWSDQTGVSALTTGTTIPGACQGPDPVPPPGDPPSAMQIRNGRASPGCSTSSKESSSGSSKQCHNMRLGRSSSPAPRSEVVQPAGGGTDLDALADVSDDNLDALMDMVMDMAPSSKQRAESCDSEVSSKRRHRRRSPAPSTIGMPYSCGGALTAVDGLPLHGHASPTLRPPKQLAPLDVTDWSGRKHADHAGDHLPAIAASRSVFTTASGSGAARQASALDTMELSTLARLVVQAYAAVNVAPACGQVPEALGAAHVFKVFTGQLSNGIPTEEARWLEHLPDLCELVLKSFRYALKVTVDCAAMAEDASLLEYSELEVALLELERSWHLGEEGATAWKASMQERVPNLMSLRKRGVSDVQVLRLCLREDGVRVGELRSEVVHSMWASESLELRYCTNDDDERYSIQAHPTLLRNMIVQSAEYPIFVSPPTTVWL